jgi:adenylosuccinate synthase
MPCTIVVGGQYGSEGKGKVTSILANTMDEPWLVRCGGPNSGHTITFRGENRVLRQLPACPDHPNATYLVAAGCAIEEQILLDETDLLGIPRHRIIVDPRAVLVSDEDKRKENDSLTGIGSTCSGTGAALVRRMSRTSEVKLAGDSHRIASRCTVGGVAESLHRALERGHQVVVEGTQGFGLSLLHGPDYPYVTSRDTTASGFAAEVGLSPRHVDHIVMVIRTFPIRVGGTSGPFPDEITWDDVQRFAGAPAAMPEYTSVTNRLRRVARFDLSAVKAACKYNAPTALAIMGLDRIDHSNHDIKDGCLLSRRAKDFMSMIERETGVSIHFVGTGFASNDAIQIPIGGMTMESLNVCAHS